MDNGIAALPLRGTAAGLTGTAAKGNRNPKSGLGQASKRRFQMLRNA